MPNKKELTKNLGQLGVQPQAEGKSKASGVVQLTCNAKGHQFGETFKAADAKKLGILDKCKPFTPAK